MAEPLRLSVAALRGWLGQHEIDKGRAYALGGAVMHPRRQGTALRAQVMGSSARPYETELVLGERGIIFADCSCPVGDGGKCKHVAALGLYWLDHAEAFGEAGTVDALLRGRGEDELIALIKRMIARYPDLEGLVELSLATRERAPDAHIVRRLVKNTFSSSLGWEDDYRDYSEVAHDLLELVASGDRALLEGDVPSAKAVYETVRDGVMEEFKKIAYDREGDLHEVVSRCAEGLASCLAAVSEAPAREELLRSLFGLYRRDAEMGGYGLGEGVPEMILHYATGSERKLVASWVRELLSEGDSSSDDFRRKQYGGFLIELQQDTLDDEAFLELCRETGRHYDLIERLLHLRRVDEALREAEGFGDYELLRTADLFVARGHGPRIKALIETRAKESTGSRLTLWLRDWAREHGDVVRALELSEALFWHRPDLEGYRELKADAEHAARWPKLKAGLLERLEEGERYELLTEIHLLEKDVAAALKTVSKVRGWSAWGGEPLGVRVAKAAEKDHPEEALALYRQHAESIVERRDRGRYAEAVRYLLRVRELYGRLGREGEWQAYLERLKEENRRLRALKEELARAGL